MICARFSSVADGLQLAMRDHATGSPMVCAGASAIVWALAGWLHNHGPEGTVINLRAGDAFVQCGRSPETETAFELALIGLRQMEKKYGEYIKVEVVT